MGIFSCCFAPEPVEPPAPQIAQQVVAVRTAEPDVIKTESGAERVGGGTEQLAERDSEWSKSWSKLNQTETTAVQQTLLKVSELIERFAEGSAEREAPVHALKKALQLVATDCHASYASMSVVSTDQQTFLIMGCVGSSHEATTLPNLVTNVAGSGSSVERLMKSPPSDGGAAAAAVVTLDPAAAAAASSNVLHWTADDGVAPPSDWLQLQQAGIRHIHAMPIRGGDALLGVLNLGFKHEPSLDMGNMGSHLFSTYLNLVSATLTAVVRDPGLNAYVCLARELAASSSLDGIMQAALVGSRAALTRLKGLGGSGGGGAGSHTWLRLALISGDKSAAALFDDLSQAGVARSSKRSGTGASSSSAQWVATIQAAGGLVRTNIPMKNTILRIALTNKKQVLIPDVQKLINQLGNVNTDLFASRLLRPPSSVLLLPLRASGVGIYGALYCLADVHTEFSEVAKQLKEVAELLGSGLNRQLSGALAHEYMGIQQLNHEQLLSRDAGNESGNSLGGATGHSSGIYGGAITPSSVTPATTAGSLPTGACSYSTTTEGSFYAAATAGGALEFGSTIGTHASWTGSIHGSMCSAGGSFTANGGLLGRSFTTRQVASSTNAVATGITEKLNQKRIDAAMTEHEEETLGALQLVAQIGEGGFAKVFRGLYRGLVVAVKVVAVGDPSNERAVMKNAHEIAILRSSSHPNIIQAYSCMTDVHIRDVVALCTRNAPRQQRSELIAALTACAGGSQRNAGSAGSTAADDATCHIEVVEYCDLGNLTTAIRNQIFSLPALSSGPASHHSRHSRHSRHSSHHSSNAAYDSDDASAAMDGSSVCTTGSPVQQQLQQQPSSGGRSQLDQQQQQQQGQQLPGRLRVNMRWLLLTLLEVAEGMAYLHRMGVVHCDLKPANVLLKSSNADIRGFTAKVSDFGLSRVEDDDTCATFPFNSCGTAAYVAPEALITTKKVNASVDVYAFGVMMWELFVGQRPYGNMSQQKVVEEVVLRGLRPSFPVGTPPGYAQLAASCWHATAGARPTFQEVIGRLQAMLHQAEESEAAAAASCSLTGSEAWGGRADGLGTPAGAQQLAAAGSRGNMAAAVAAAAAAQQNAAAAAAARSTLQPGPRVATSEAAAAAAAAIAEAAAQWNKQAQQQQQLSGRPSLDGRPPSSPGMQQAQQQAQAALLQWQQQQQQQLLQQQHSATQQQQLPKPGDDPSAAAAVKAAMAAAGSVGPGEPYQRSRSAGQPTSRQQTAAAAALAAAAAAGSVYEFQQVGFTGETVVGTGTVGNRFSSGGGTTAAAPAAAAAAAGMMGSVQQQQLLQAAAQGGMYDHMVAVSGKPVRRPPTRSKTFSAGSNPQQQFLQQQYDQMVAAATAAGDAGGGMGFNYSAGGAGELSQLQQQQLLLQRQHQQLLQQVGYTPTAGLLAGQQRQQQLAMQQMMQQQQGLQFAFSNPAPGGAGGSPYANSAFQAAMNARQGGAGVGGGSRGGLSSAGGSSSSRGHRLSASGSGGVGGMDGQQQQQ